VALWKYPIPKDTLAAEPVVPPPDADDPVAEDADVEDDPAAPDLPDEDAQAASTNDPAASSDTQSQRLR
jgi:hypothetical protein